MARRRYRGIVHDSARWDGFELRPGDIVISTPPKCGTTWTQMICALLVFQEPSCPTGSPRSRPGSTWSRVHVRRCSPTRVPRPTAGSSRRTRRSTACRSTRPSRTSASVAILGTWRCRWTTTSTTSTSTSSCGPEPRRRPSTASSSRRCTRRRHEPTTPRRGSGAGSTTTPTRPTRRPTCASRSATSRASGTRPPTSTSSCSTTTTSSTTSTARWPALAQRLEIDVPERRWSELVEAATFEGMRRRADVTVPGASPRQWRDPDRFFHKGTSGQWRDLLDESDLARYTERVRPLLRTTWCPWVHHGTLGDLACRLASVAAPRGSMVSCRSGIR